MFLVTLRRPSLWLWLGCWLLLAWCLWTPIPSAALKVAALGAVALLITGALWLLPRARKGICVALVLGVALFCWPQHAVDSRQLARFYVAALRDYRGTRYVWGGENARGLDCSGLMRRGWMDALRRQGIQTRNPALWRVAATIWWRDCSAREMENGYGGRIVRRFESASLNALDTKRLQLGDLAVMRSGVHVLAFVGDGTWIQADPSLANGGDKVIETRAPSRSGWFNQKVVICRWQLLD